MGEERTQVYLSQRLSPVIHFTMLLMMMGCRRSTFSDPVIDHDNPHRTPLDHRNGSEAFLASTASVWVDGAAPSYNPTQNRSRSFLRTCHISGSHTGFRRRLLISEYRWGEILCGRGGEAGTTDRCRQVHRMKSSRSIDGRLYRPSNSKPDTHGHVIGCVLSVTDSYKIVI